MTIDEKSLDELGRWPWPRVRMAQLLDGLVKNDVKVVGFDVVWAEPDENSELKGLAALKQKLQEMRVQNRALENYLSAAIRQGFDKTLGVGLAPLMVAFKEWIC